MSDEDRSLAEWAAKDVGDEPRAAASEPVEPITPVAEAVVETAEATEPVAEPVAAEEPEADPQPVPEPAKGKKVTPLPAWMKERLAEQTAKQREAERLAVDAEARAKVAQAELEDLRRQHASGETPLVKPSAAPTADYVPRSEVERLATEKSRMDAFNAQADQAYFAGKASYKDFDEALQPLTAMGALQRLDFQEAALATGSAHDVLYELGTDPDRASQILGYLRTGNTAKATAEMTKIAIGVEQRKAAATKPKKTPVSQVPAPIRPVGGSAMPTVDLEKADDATFDRELSKMLAAKGW